MEARDDYLRRRTAQRKGLPRKVLWDISSSSSPSRSRSRSLSPVKEEPPKAVVHTVAPPPTAAVVIGPTVEQEAVPGGVYRVTTKDERREADPRFLEHMGYMNRNARPVSSKRKEILVRVDERRPTVSPATLQERKTREAQLIQQFRGLVERQREGKST